MSEKDRDAVKHEPELSKDHKDGIVAIMQMGHPFRLRSVGIGATDARGHIDPSEKSIAQSTDAEIKSRKPDSDGMEFNGHPHLADSLAQMIIAHPDHEGLKEALSRAIMGGEVSYEDSAYQQHHYIISTKEEARDTAGLIIEAARAGTTQEDYNGSITYGDGDPNLQDILASAIDSDIKAHLVPAQNTPSVVKGSASSQSKIPGKRG